MCVSGDSTHTLKIVQCNTFTGQKHTNISGNCSHELSLFYGIPIFTEKFCLCVLI